MMARYLSVLIDTLNNVIVSSVEVPNELFSDVDLSKMLLSSQDMDKTLSTHDPLLNDSVSDLLPTNEADTEWGKKKILLYPSKFKLHRTHQV